MKLHKFSLPYRRSFIGLFEQGHKVQVNERGESVLIQHMNLRNGIGYALNDSLARALCKSFHFPGAHLCMKYPSQQFDNFVAIPMGWLPSDDPWIKGLQDLHDMSPKSGTKEQYRRYLIESYLTMSKYLYLPYDPIYDTYRLKLAG